MTSNNRSISRGEGSCHNIASATAPSGRRRDYSRCPPTPRCVRILSKAPLGHTFFECMLGFARTNTPKGADMRFYTKTHKHYCGIDLHAKKMYLCILDASGNVLLHRNIASSPESFLKAVAPFRDDLIVGVECLFAWYWLADLCRKEDRVYSRSRPLYERLSTVGKRRTTRSIRRK